MVQAIDGRVFYNGAYVPLHDVKMSQAFASTLDLSFEVRGGLLMRQIHHWAALLFLAAMSVHMLRIFFTGAFRKPREINWVIGSLLLVLGVAAGFSGYSSAGRPTLGHRNADHRGRHARHPGQDLPVVLPVRGEYPGDEMIARLYPIHILLVPGLILALVTVH